MKQTSIQKKFNCHILWQLFSSKLITKSFFLCRIHYLNTKENFLTFLINIHTIYSLLFCPFISNYIIKVTISFSTESKNISLGGFIKIFFFYDKYFQIAVSLTVRIVNTIRNETINRLKYFLFIKFFFYTFTNIIESLAQKKGMMS